MDKPELSIVIVSFNTAQVTLDCINSIVKSLKNSDLNYEIVVVDNNSTDGSVEMLKKFKIQNSKFKILESKSNLGFGKGNNLGVKHARGKYILLLNSDILVQGDAIEKLYKFYKQNNFEFTGGKLLNKDMSPQPSAGPFYSLPVIFGALFLKGDYWGLTRYSPSRSRRVDWVSGACIMTTKNEFLSLNGFDEEIFMYMEEIDLLYRAKKESKSVGFYPEARFIHLGSASSDGKTYPILQVYRGFIYFYRKHHSKLAISLLKFMLKLKALISLSLGHILRSQYLIETYEKAYKMVSQD